MTDSNWRLRVKKQLMCRFIIMLLWFGLYGVGWSILFIFHFWTQLLIWLSLLIYIF